MEAINSTNSVIGMLWFITDLIVWVGLALWKNRKHSYSIFRMLGLIIALGAPATHLALTNEQRWPLPPDVPLLAFCVGFTLLIIFSIYDEMYCDCHYPSSSTAKPTQK